MNKSCPARGISRTAVLALLAAASLASVPAFASRGITVTRSPDPQVTYLRLQRASAELCGPVNRMDLARVRVWQRCYERTLDGAVAQLQEPELLAIHRRHVQGTASGTG